MEVIKRYWRRALRGSVRSPTIYYIAGDGNDANDGKHPLQAWQSIERLNSARTQIKASDQILFKRGFSYAGRPFYFDHADSERQIGAYGSGKYPVFPQISNEANHQ